VVEGLYRLTRFCQIKFSYSFDEYNNYLLKKNLQYIGIFNFIFFSESNIVSIVNRFVCFLSLLLTFYRGLISNLIIGLHSKFAYFCTMNIYVENFMKFSSI